MLYKYINILKQILTNHKLFKYLKCVGILLNTLNEFYSVYYIRLYCNCFNIYYLPIYSTVNARNNIEMSQRT